MYINFTRHFMAWNKLQAHNKIDSHFIECGFVNSLLMVPLYMGDMLLTGYSSDLLNQSKQIWKELSKVLGQWITSLGWNSPVQQGNIHFLEKICLKIAEEIQDGRITGCFYSTDTKSEAIKIKQREINRSINIQKLNWKPALSNNH